MKRWIVIIILATIALSFNAAQAKVPADRFKQWAQQPDWINGFDVLSNDHSSTLVATDFTSDGRSVTDVIWWGSYSNNKYIAPKGFWLGFWSDMPNASPDHPGQLLKSYSISFSDTNETRQRVQMRTGNWGYQYSTDILADPFLEKKGIVYWLSIQAIYEENAGDTWGWKTSTLHYRSEALQATANLAPNLGTTWPNQFVKVVDPLTGSPADMAFKLTTTTAPEPVSSLLFIAGGVLLSGGRYLKGKKQK